MNSTTDPSAYRHPKHDAMARMILDGATDTTVAAELHVDRRAPARVRRILGLKPMTNSTTTAQKLARYSNQPDAAGHVTWTGRRSHHGRPVIRHLGREIPAAAVAFEQRTGRQPVGICRADCDVRHCVALDHVTDDLERRQVRLQLRAVYGWDEPWDVCPTAGHPWDENGRVEPDLTLYCRACNTNRARRVRDARKEEATA